MLRDTVCGAAILSLAAFLPAAEHAVKPVGTYPFLVPSSFGKAKVHLWCSGVDLMGVVVVEGCRPARAIVLRDGRCEPQGSQLSFGFMYSRDVWVSEPPTYVPTPSRLRFLYRFEGAVKKGMLDGVLQEVDLNHPGNSFQRYRISVDALPEVLESFDDESEWHRSIQEAFQTVEPDS